MRLGDLDALKKAINDFYDNHFKGLVPNELITYAEVVDNAIDNAPTVEPCNDCEDRKQAEYIRHSSSWHELQALRKFKEEHDRPQGEWIEVEKQGKTGDGRVFTFTIIVCSKCGEQYDLEGEKFCPHCGADMRGSK